MIFFFIVIGTPIFYKFYYSFIHSKEDAVAAEEYVKLEKVADMEFFFYILLQFVE